MEPAPAPVASAPSQPATQQIPPQSAPVTQPAASTPPSPPAAPAPGEVSSGAPAAGPPEPLSAPPVPESQPTLSQEQYAQLVKEFGVSQAQQIMQATGVQPPQQVPQGAPKPSQPTTFAASAQTQPAATTTATQPTPAASAPTQSGFDPEIVEAAKKVREGELRRKEILAAYQEMYPSPQDVFDAEAEARKALDAEDRRKQVMAAIAAMRPPEPETPFDPMEEAKKRFEAEDRRKAIAYAMEQLRPTQPEPEEVFDPAAEARKKIEAEDKRAAVNAEYEKLRPAEPETPFDPVALAKQKREEQVKEEQVRAAYDSLYGTADEIRSVFDVTLDVAQQMRGTIGGAFGTLFGAALDITALIRKEAEKSSVSTPKEMLRREAEQRNAMPSQVEAPKAATPPPLPPEPAPQTEPLEPLEVDGKTFSWEDAPDLQEQQAETTTTTTPAATGDAAKAADSMGALAESASNAASQTAGLSTGAANAASASSSLAKAMGPLGVAATATALGLNALDRVIQPLIQNYADYNPQVAMAQAMAEVRTTFGDMRRAQESGPQLASYIKAQTELQQKWEDVKVGLLTKLMPIAEAIMELISTLLPIVQTGLQPVAVVAELIGKILKAITGFFASQSDQDSQTNLDPFSVLLSGYTFGQPAGSPGVQVPNV